MTAFILQATMCYKHRKEIKFPSFFLILWTCIVVLAESSRLNSRKYLAKGQNPLCQELPLLTAKLDFWPRRSCLLLLKRSQPPKMFPSTRSCLGLYAHQVWASPPYFLEAMKRRLDSRLKCRIARGFPDDLIVNIQHCGYAFLSVL